jgi:shikimate dehydrogenase
MRPTSQTRLLCLLGHPVVHSKSPLMHNAALAHMGLDFTYLAFDVEPESLRAAVEGLRALKARGWNVTVPHKVAILPYLDELSKEASLIGAVNTVVNEEGRLVGYNTDGSGYLRSLQEETGFLPRGKHVCVLGAGGAARTIALQLALAGAASVTIANRTLSRALLLADEVSRLTPAEAVSMEQLGNRRFDLMVNATSVGMHPNIESTPLHAACFQPGMIVSDIVYNPAETRFLREAAAAGAVCHGGAGMLVYQGAIAFELWTGKKAPVELMRKAVLGREAP